MFTRTAALMSRSFCELTQVLICMRRPLIKRVSRALRGLCNCGVSAKSSMTTSTWYSFFISNFLDASVILRCCWMMRRSAASSHSSRYVCSRSVHPQVPLNVLLDGDPAVDSG